MSKITQAEFDAIERDEKGVKTCPPGDYSEIKSFGEGCRFGEGCSFGERCSFGEWCSFENGKKCKPGVPFIRVNNIGSRVDGCQIFNLIDGLYVRCGCWAGGVNAFVKRVKEAHAGTVHEKTYLLAVEMAKAQFEEVKQ